MSSAKLFALPGLPGFVVFHDSLLEVDGFFSRFSMVVSQVCQCSQFLRWPLCRLDQFLKLCDGLPSLPPSMSLWLEKSSQDPQECHFHKKNRSNCHQLRTSIVVTRNFLLGLKPQPGNHSHRASVPCVVPSADYAVAGSHALLPCGPGVETIFGKEKEEINFRKCSWTWFLFWLFIISSFCREHHSSELSKRKITWSIQTRLVLNSPRPMRPHPSFEAQP